jgi:hypothetical protein
MKLASVLGLCLTVLVALVAAGVSAQTMTNPDITSSTTTTTPAGIPTVSASPATTATPVVLNIVEITRLVPSGTTAVSAFTVPAGQTLIVTDALVTNTGTEATCGAAINRGGGSAAAVTTPTTRTATGTTTTAATTATGTTTTTPSTTGTTATAPGTTAGVPALAGTLTQTDSTITGPLCVAARTTTPLPLTTGVEFGPGQVVQLINVPDATTSTGTAGTATPAGAVGFHLRGMLVAG